MKIALAQINPTVADIAGNSRLIRQALGRGKAQKADLVVFPELCLTGYPPRDLLDQPRFIEANRQALQALAHQVHKPAALVGFIDFNPKSKGKHLYNAAALLYKGRIQAVRYKTLLPTYDVFDEARYFEPAHQNKPIPFLNKKLGVSICEDIWNDAAFWPRPLYGLDPVEKLVQQGADVLINMSSSPFHRAKTRLRLDMIRSHIQKFHRPFVFVNQVGGNDDLVFDGNSLALDATGGILAQGKSFQEDVFTVNLNARGSRAWKEAPEIEQIHNALVLGLCDYTRKCGFKKVLLGLSGGIDSAVTACLAVRALGARNVLGVSMPSMYSSRGSLVDAQKLAKALKIKLLSLPITPVYKSYQHSLEKAFAGYSPDVTEENLQARIRGTLLMALSNKYQALLLTTGNKSELSMGYCTLYGDMNGGLAVISDVPKGMVYALGRFINHRTAFIPEASFTKPPSAELRPHQTDQDTLPPYDVLDAILEAYVEEGKDVEAIVDLGYPVPLVRQTLKTIDRNEYKRRQAAPGLRITPKAFGIGRRMPIARGDFRS